MPDLPKTCANCCGQSLYVTNTNATGAYGPNLLPGLGSFLSSAKFHVVLCADCGYTTFFADEAAREKVRNSWKWRQA